MSVDAGDLTRTSTADLLKEIYGCPVYFKCGPCERRISELAVRASRLDDADPPAPQNWQRDRLLILGRWGYDTSMMYDRKDESNFLTDEWLDEWFGADWAEEYVLKELAATDGDK